MNCQNKIQTKNQCKKHQQEYFALILEKEGSTIDKLICQQCFNEKDSAKVVALQKIQKTIVGKKEKLCVDVQKEVQGIIEQITTFTTQFEEIKNLFTNTYNTLYQISQKWINIIDQESKLSHSTLIDDIDNYFLQTYDSIKLKQNLLLKINSINQEYCKTIQEEISKLDIKKIEQFLESPLSKQNKVVIEQQQKFNNGRKNFAFSFNFKGDLLVSNTDNIIQVWKIDNSVLSPNPLIFKNHIGRVLSLEFSKKINWFVSGSGDIDKSIICWKEKNQKWSGSDRYICHSGSVRYLQLNNEEDQLISGDSKGEIRIWEININENVLKNIQLLENGHIQDSVINGLSLNYNGDSLLSCGIDNKVILWQKDNQGKWMNKYIKDFQTEGRKLCFISNNQFIWVPWNIGKMYVFQINKNDFQELNQFEMQLSSETQDLDLFPPVFIYQHNLLLLRNSNKIFFLKRQLNGSFIVLNTINCISHRTYGSISNNGKQFIYWNKKSKEISFYNIDYE